ncbi:MAG: SPOR domain-containing protein [Proteobacteria bacterium]|nr:SPOR domain-containing protein [Candidatus Enterousia scatequi]
MEDENLDLLDLDDAASDSLPDAAPLVAPRPKKPWLLMVVGLAVIALATFIIVHTISSENSSAVDIDLDVPAVVVDGDVADIKPAEPKKPEVAPAPVAPLPQPAVKEVEKPAPVAQANANPSAPVHVIQDRKEVTFNPDKPANVKPAAKAAQKKAVAKPAVKTSSNSWYVQLGSYSSRSLAESGERQLRRAHPGLLEGQQTVILAAVLKNGTTTYRLRAVFNNQNDANGFCRNAKSDGLDCYVAK